MKDQRGDKRGPNIDVTEEQIEEALNRLFVTVQDEPVPDIWRRREHGLEPQAERETAGADAAQARAQQAEAGKSYSQNIKPTTAHRAGLGAELQSAAPVSRTTVPSSTPKSRPGRKWLAATAAAVAAVAILFTSLGQDVMASMLHTFRLQHLETVSFSESDLNGLRQALEDGTLGTRQLDLRLYGEIQQNGGGTQRIIGAEEAERLAGRKLKPLPGADAGAISYLPEQELTFKLHPKEINKLIVLLGGKTKLPAAVDNVPIKLLMPNSFTTAPRNSDGIPSSKRLVQLPSPALDVPGNVDIEQIRQAVLDLPLLPAEFRAKLAAIGNWRSTLPIPSLDGLNSRTLGIAGQDAILTTSSGSRILVWLQNGWLYMLSGSLSDYTSDDAIIKEAEGLMKA